MLNRVQIRGIGRLIYNPRDPMFKKPYYNFLGSINRGIILHKDISWVYCLVG
jgi:hypothetical protein